MRRNLRDMSERDIERGVDCADDQRLRELEAEAEESEEEEEENPCEGCSLRGRRCIGSDCPLF